MAAMTPERREKLEDRLKWLDDALAKLQVDFRNAPRMLWLALLAVPAWFVNWMVSALVLFSAVMLWGVQLYVAWVHINEYETERRFIREELGEVARDLST
ncbi:MAG: hypothetical protein JNK72_23810 [Myxococcales bacterium]|nr:hypothetical protein [Myxococcales bacterium]